MQFHTDVPFQLERDSVKFEKYWKISRGGTIVVYFVDLYYIENWKIEYTDDNEILKISSKTLKSHS